MNKSIIRIDITEDEKLYIEKENYETNGYLTLLQQFTRKNSFDINEERYNKLIDEYMEHYMNYNLYLSILVEKYFKEKSNYIVNQIDCDLLNSQLILKVTNK